MKFPEIFVNVVLLSSAAVARASDAAPKEALDRIDSSVDPASLANNEVSTSSLRRRVESRKLWCQDWYDNVDFEYRGTKNYCKKVLQRELKKGEEGWVRMVCKDPAETTWDEKIGDYCKRTCVPLLFEDDDSEDFTRQGPYNYCRYLRENLDIDKDYVNDMCYNKADKHGLVEIGDHCSATCFAAGWNPKCSIP